MLSISSALHPARRSLRAVLPAAALLLTASLVVGCSPGDERPSPEDIRPVPSQAEPGTIEEPRLQAELRYELPESWTTEPPSSNFRIAQARVPGPGGDAELALFYFGPGQGGGVEANIDRWLAQVAMEPGTEPMRETFEVGELTVHRVEAAGSVTPSPMNMSGATAEAQTDARLLAAVVEGPGGPWFIKMVGPEATVSEARDDFDAMLQGLSAEPTGQSVDA